MRAKAASVLALATLIAGVGLAGTLRAQEKSDAEGLVRVLAFGQGSYLGVYIADVTGEDVDRLGLREERGVLITGVADEGPARDAGLQEDDVILSWNGDRVESEAQLRRILGETPAGRTATVGLIRGGSERSLTVVLGETGGMARSFNLRSGWNEGRVLELREQLEMNRDHLRDLNVRIREMPHVLSFMSQRGGRLGVGIQNLEPQLAEYFGLGDRTGVLITTVKDDSPAASAGLRAGDVIIAVDGEEIDGPGDVSGLVWKAEVGPVAIRILRDRSEKTITVDLPEEENRWESTDGEVHGFFFGPEDSPSFDFNFSVPRIRVMPRHLELRDGAEGPLNWVPFRATTPETRTLSI